MKVLVDMNLSPRWIELLKAGGWEAMHWSALGRPTAPDSEIMAYAAANDCVVLTHDLDFSAILAVTHGQKPSVVQVRSDDVSPDRIGTLVLTALDRAKLDLEAGALLTIDTIRTRLRLLPLKTND